MLRMVYIDELFTINSITSGPRLSLSSRSRIFFLMLNVSSVLTRRLGTPRDDTLLDISKTVRDIL